MQRVIFGLCLIIIFFQANAQEKPRLLLLTGENNHDWRETTPVLREILESANFVVRITEEPAVLATPAMKNYDAIVMNYNQNPRWTPEIEKAFLDYVRQGGGLVVVHAANNAFPGWKEFDELVGLTWREGAGHDRFGKFQVEITEPEHSAMQGVTNFEIEDELYRNLTQASEFKVLARAFSKDKQAYFAMILVKKFGAGRVFHTVLGHNAVTMKYEGFRKTLVKGTHWAINRLPE
jgi:type 1 glutamine amidotransferase